MAQHSSGNGQPFGQPSATGGVATQQLIVNAQYIKDLSFENPRAPESLMQQAEPPSVNMDVKAQGIGPENYEVVLTTKAEAKTENEVLFLVELSYAGDGHHPQCTAAGAGGRAGHRGASPDFSIRPEHHC
jgi:preprotein translocase subunit SecB